MTGFHLGLMFHRPPMLMVDDLLESDAGGGTAVLTVRANNIFLGANGRLSRVGLMEIIAQSFAATEAYQAWLAGTVKPGGYLVGLDNVTFHGDATVGDTLTTKVVSEGNIDRVAMVSGETRRGETLLVTGKFRLYSV
ncbi:MAG: hypothetical protein LBD30_06225 [Verrucomicrobiales bacterium]|jgi:3-hydroxymyristoyl/3-hydroxydecanoyl-(acyl carrier protein) dehydratase|nr:hypothetical protein [Verrucomicrobiales bacterium]